MRRVLSMRSCVSRSVLPVSGFQLPGAGHVAAARQHLQWVSLGKIGLEDLELQLGGLAARQRALDAVDIALISKSQADLCCAGLGVDQQIIPLARLTEERPGDGIQER